MSSDRVPISRSSDNRVAKPQFTLRNLALTLRKTTKLPKKLTKKGEIKLINSAEKIEQDNNNIEEMNNNNKTKTKEKEKVVSTHSESSKRTDQGRKDFNLTADRQVELALNAKRKVLENGAELKNLRKAGEVLGPSVAMLAHHENTTRRKPNKRFFPVFNLALANVPVLNSSGKMTLTQKNDVLGPPPKAEQDVAMIIEALKKLVIIAKLNDVTIEALAKNMRLMKVKRGDDICKQGEYGEEMYVIKSGEFAVIDESKQPAELPVEVLHKSKPEKSGRHSATRRSSAGGSYAEEEVGSEASLSMFAKQGEADWGMARLRPGTAFGELGLHYGSPRERTIKALQAGELWVLRRDIYSRMVENEYTKLNELLLEALGKVNILEKLVPEQLKNLLKFTEIVNFKKGQKIIEQGSVAGTFYMIVSGTVDCIVTATPENAGRVEAIPSETDSFHGENDRNREDTEAALENPDERKAFDETALGSGKERSKTSNIDPTAPKRSVYSYGPGDYFGERGLLKNDFIRKADVVATSDVELLAITYKTFTEHLSGLINYFEENIRLQALEDAPFFAHLTREEQQALQKVLLVKEFKDNECIIRENSENRTFYIVRDGEVFVKRSLDNDSEHSFEITVLKEKNYFGEGSVMNGTLANASIIAKGKVSCYALDADHFRRFVNKEKIQLLQETYNERTRSGIREKLRKTQELLNKVQLADVKVLTTLGSGCFGLVKLVEIKKVRDLALNSVFALKILEKGVVVKNNQEINVMNEKNILMDSDHPFIVKLYRTFKDKLYLYYLMEFIQGGELFQYLHTECKGHFSNETAQFYVACVVDALDYLHMKHIVYRDLKPENLMIDSEGYGRIVDFGFAKRLVFRTFTLCGTAQYLAPEILLNGGYSRTVDFWTLGILIYELFTGTTPFKRKSRDELFNAIKYENRIRFQSKYWKDTAAKDLVCKLLHKHPRKRLGCTRTGGFKDVKAHDWLKDIDFHKLKYKEYPAPWIPEITDPKDVSNFEEYDEEENPLQGKYDDKTGDEDVWKDF